MMNAPVRSMSFASPTLAFRSAARNKGATPATAVPRRSSRATVRREGTAAKAQRELDQEERERCLDAALSAATQRADAADAMLSAVAKKADRVAADALAADAELAEERRRSQVERLLLREAATEATELERRRADEAELRADEAERLAARLRAKREGLESEKTRAFYELEACRERERASEEARRRGEAAAASSLEVLRKELEQLRQKTAGVEAVEQRRLGLDVRALAATQRHLMGRAAAGEMAEQAVGELRRMVEAHGAALSRCARADTDIRRLASELSNAKAALAAEAEAREALVAALAEQRRISNSRAELLAAALSAGVRSGRSANLL